MRVLQTVLTVFFLQSIAGLSCSTKLAITSVTMIHTFNAATEVTFSLADWNQVSCGEQFILNCTGSFFHNIEIQEIGQNNTIDRMIMNNMSILGNPTHEYVPENCSSDPTMTNKTCSKIINITVTDAMHGKSYQCVSYKRGILNPPKYYSQGGYIAGEQSPIKTIVVIIMVPSIVEDIEACTDEISCKCNF